MSHNIRFLVFLIPCLLFSFAGECQMVDELRDLDTLAKPSLDETFTQFQISADLTSISAGLLGGASQDNFHFGIQAKYLRNKLGYRFQLEYYPQSKVSWFFSPGRAIDLQGDEVLYLNSFQQGRMIRSRFGIERQLKQAKGRSYIGMDMPVSYEFVTIDAFNYWLDPVQNELVGTGFNNNSVTVHNVGVGFVPFLGYEFHVGNRLGFNIEAKADFNLMFGEGYFIADNADITKSGQTFNFRTFPLLNFRIHYRI